MDLIVFLKRTQSWVGRHGAWIWEDLEEDMNMIKIYCAEFSKN